MRLYTKDNKGKEISQYEYNRNSKSDETYGDFTAVSHLNLHIRKGSVYGFLGPNGAGKSTTMKMFLGLTQPTEGSFHIDGKHTLQTEFPF